MRIFRFFEGGDYERHALLPTFHAFVWNHSNISPAEAREIKGNRELQEDGQVLSLPYFNVLDRGLAEWSSPWFDWLQQTTGKLYPPDSPGGGEQLHAITWGGRDMIDWPHFTFAKVMEMVSVMRNSCGGDGLYFDQYWRLVYDWMFSSLGAPYSAFPVHYWGVWRWCLDFLAQFANEVTAGKVWANAGFASAHSAPHCHRIYEHAQMDYDATKDAWIADMDAGKESVLTVDANEAPWAVDRLLADWQAIGKGWVGFTTRDGSPGAALKVDLAYVRAAEVQAAQVPPSMGAGPA